MKREDLIQILEKNNYSCIKIDPSCGNYYQLNSLMVNDYWKREYLFHIGRTCKDTNTYIAEMYLLFDKCKKAHISKYLTLNDKDDDIDSILLDTLMSIIDDNVKESIYMKKYQIDKL